MTTAAEQRFQQMAPLNPTVETVFDREGDAALDLMAVGGGRFVGLRSQAIGRHGAERGAIGPRRVDAGAGRLHSEMDFGQPVLDRLKGAERSSELVTVRDVTDRPVEHLRRPAQPVRWLAIGDRCRRPGRSRHAPHPSG